MGTEAWQSEFLILPRLPGQGCPRLGREERSPPKADRPLPLTPSESPEIATDAQAGCDGGGTRGPCEGADQETVRLGHVVQQTDDRQDEGAVEGSAEQKRQHQKELGLVERLQVETYRARDRTISEGVRSDGRRVPGRPGDWRY